LLVITLWDLTDCNTWLSDKVAQEWPAMLCKLVGWFINKDKDVIRISSNICGDGDKTITVIPRGSIKNISIVTYDREGI